jgi:hypothetical protein
MAAIAESRYALETVEERLAGMGVDERSRDRMAAYWRAHPPVGAPQVFNLDGVPHHKAPIPRRWHRCWVQTYGYLGGFDVVERCACGAIRRGGTRRWSERNSRRRT